MKFFSAWLCVLLVVVGVGLQGLAQPAPPNARDFLLIEALLSMQGAVIGGGLGVFGVTQGLDTLSPCGALAEEERSACELGQSFRSLCLGSAFGIPIGATFLGLSLAQVILGVQGNLWAALLGSMVGELVGIPQCSLLGNLPNLSFQSNFVVDSDVSLLLNPIVLSAFGATLGYNFDLLFEPTFSRPTMSIQLPVFAWIF